MKQAIYVCLFIAVACASVLAQELPVGDPVAPNPGSIWNDATFNSSLSIVIGFVIAWITSMLKRIEFVNQQPKVAAAVISMLASGVTVLLGVRAGAAWGILIVSTITQLASAVLAFEAVKSATPEKARAKRARKATTANPYRPSDAPPLPKRGSADDDTPTGPLQ